MLQNISFRLRKKFIEKYFSEIHDALWDPDELSLNVIQHLRQANALARLLTICKILSEPDPIRFD